MNKSLSELKEEFDQVKLKHFKDERYTVAVLWQGKERYVGVAYCNKGDQFNKKIAREIALGRAYNSSLNPLLYQEYMDYTILDKMSLPTNEKHKETNLVQRYIPEHLWKPYNERDSDES